MRSDEINGVVVKPVEMAAVMAWEKKPENRRTIARLAMATNDALEAQKTDPNVGMVIQPDGVRAVHCLIALALAGQKALKDETAKAVHQYEYLAHKQPDNPIAEFLKNMKINFGKPPGKPDA